MGTEYMVCPALVFIDYYRPRPVVNKHADMDENFLPLKYVIFFHCLKSIHVCI